MNLAEEPRIIGLANALSLDAVRPVEAIVDYCHAKVREFVKKCGVLDSVISLQQAVCMQLRLEVREIWSDEELADLSGEYVNQGEIVFATLASELTPDAFGILIQLWNVPNSKSPRFVAVIDCRGEKFLRRYWTLWHEIAHCLTAVDQYQLPLRRTTVDAIEKDPIEKLTDMVAGEFAFYGPLFDPVLNEELTRQGKLTFEGVERVRSRFCSDASMSATINACVKGAGSPIIVLEAGMGFKKAERMMVNSGVKGIQASLRVLRSIGNESARRQAFFIPPQMRVPIESIIAHVFNGGRVNDSSASEEMEHWMTSSGKKLPSARVSVQARRAGDRVVALVALAS